MLPTKELMGVVLNLKIESYSLHPDVNASITGTNHFYSITTDTGVGYAINIYEFAHLCKVWAYSIGYELLSRYSKDPLKSSVQLLSFSQFVGEGIWFTSSTENTAIITSCEWLLGEIK